MSSYQYFSPHRFYTEKYFKYRMGLEKGITLEMMMVFQKRTAPIRPRTLAVAARVTALWCI
jgi:hypothetical protein